MRGIRKTAYLGLMVGAVALGGCLSGGGGGSSKSPAPSPSEPLTEQQQRIRDGFFVVQTEKLPFDDLNATHANSSRWHGVLDGAGYRVEVPEDWNGMRVMYAHGYRGNG